MIKRTYLLLLTMLFAVNFASAAIVAPAASSPAINPDLSEIFTGTDEAFSPEDFLALTPRKIRETTGRKLKLKEVIGLKLAQKQMKKQMKKQARKGHKEGDEEFPKGLFIVCAIFLPIAAVIFMGIMDDWKGNTWWTAAILYALCYLPGLIYTLTKVKNYYPSK